MTTTTYTASPTATRFHASDAFVRLVMGAIGSGKSVMCCWEIFRRAQEQLPGADGLRRSRWLIARNTYRELLDTTLKTWHDWFPQNLGNWSPSSMTHTIQIGEVYMEVLFRAFDTPDDVKKLLSLELTGAWLNEAREMPKSVFEMLQGRVGRYPSKRDGGAKPYFGIIMDSNPPDSDHWIYKTFEEDRPPGYEIYKQPSGLSPEAENIENLPPLYYERLTHGKSQEWINVYVHGQYGFVRDGMPVYPEYNDQLHAASDIILPVDNIPLYIGMDFGRTPAAVVWQRVAGQWRALSEITTENMGASTFAPLVREHILQHYPHHTIAEITGDPAGSQRAQTGEDDVYDILYANGVQASPASTNKYDIRRETLARQMLTLTFDGKPALLISPACRMLRKGLAGGYHYRRLRVGGDEKYTNEPDKNIYSHVVEAAQYGLMGGGEDKAVLTPIGAAADTRRKPPTVHRSTRPGAPSPFRSTGERDPFALFR